MGARHKLPDKQGQREEFNSCCPFMQRKMRNSVADRKQLFLTATFSISKLSIYTYTKIFKIMDYARGAYSIRLFEIRHVLSQSDWQLIFLLVQSRDDTYMIQL